MERWKETLYMPLRIQQPEAIQRGLFAHVPEPEDIDESPCDHAFTEPQPNLFGGTDEVCVSCGSRVS